MPGMDKATAAFPLLLLSLILLVMSPPTVQGLQDNNQTEYYDSLPVQNALICQSQFDLANSACSLMPYQYVPPPSPPSHGHRRHRGHGGRGHRDGGGAVEFGEEEQSHRHRHRHSRHGHRETTVEYDCCRWLKEIDDICVCDLLVHLPSFLTRPVHEYTVVVDDSCSVTFACSSRLVRR